MPPRSHPKRKPISLTRLYTRCNPPMHRIWTFDDIRWQVALFLVCEPLTTRNATDARQIEDTQEMRRSLSSLARVSKGFWDPAITLLWQNLPNLVPVLKLMDSIASSRDDKRQVCITVAHFPSPKDWDTIAYHCSKVRILTIDEGFSHKDTVHRIFDAFFQRAKDVGAPFPNLRHLHCTISSEVTPFMPAFFSPYLHTFIPVSSNRVYYPTRQILDIASTIPSLSNLILITASPNLLDKNAAGGTPDGLEGALPSLSHIHSLDADIHLTPTAMQILSHYSALRHLNVAIYNPTRSRIRLGTTAFPSLESLRLQDSLDDVENLIPLISSPHLRDLDIIIMKGSDHFEVHDLRDKISAIFASIAVLPSASRIEKLSFCPYYTKAPLLVPVIQSLQACTNLRSVRIPCIWVVLEDADLALIAQSWPKLETLSLTVGEYRLRTMSAPPVKVTMRGLQALASLEFLQRLRIYITDLSDLPPLERPQRSVSSSLSLKHLTIQVSTPFSSPTQFADLVTSTFPQLRTFVIEGTIHGSDYLEYYDPSTLIMGRQFKMSVPNAEFRCEGATLQPLPPSMKRIPRVSSLRDHRSWTKPLRSSVSNVTSFLFRS